MKAIIPILLITIATLSCTEFSKKGEDKPSETMEESTGKLRHVVLFKFKDETTSEQIDTVVKAFANLKNEIPEIQAFEWGVNNSPENLNQGLTHCFTLTFNNEKDRDAYLPHPAHKEFGKILSPHLDKVTVVDYFANK